MRYDAHTTMLPELAFRPAGRRMTLEGGGKGGSTVIDYTGAAEKQGESSRDVTAAQTWANRPALNTPWGQMAWSASGDIDPASGKPVTRWTGNVNLTPAQQQALNAQQAIQQGRSQTAQTLLGQAQAAASRPFDWGSITAGMRPGDPRAVQSGFGGYSGIMQGGIGGASTVPRVEQALFQQQLNLMEPQISQQEAQRRARMAAMGIPLEGGSEAFNRAQDQMASQRNAAYQQAGLAAITGAGQEAVRRQQMDVARQQAWNQAQAQQFGQGLQQGQFYNQAQGQEYDQRLRQTQIENQIRQQQIAEEQMRQVQPLNQLNALLSGQQVQMPQMPSFVPAQAAQPINYLSAANTAGQAAQNSAPDWGSLIGTLSGAALGVPMGGMLGGALFSGGNA